MAQKIFKKLFIINSFLIIINIFAQQIPINRVEMMPNKPSPYKMRDWKKVALGYDSMAFDFNLQGTYLPLIKWNTNTVNYPHNSFGLPSYVGANFANSGEAINVMAAVISASLVGIDKSNQNGENWVEMCEEFFNRRPEENVYLNNPITASGSDWWYNTMPNVFFYQLYDMYPNTGDFAYQFFSVADRWLEAVDSMGGNTTPWDFPYMNYRGWYLETMTPNISGVKEPEAAGAIAWILYNAYVHTGSEKYRIGAEWAVEFLEWWLTNPSYELQLPYGAYAAARMNAELGMSYNIEKFINWCFEVGPLRQWGVIVGNWGGYDVSGIIGEANGPGHYAFTMNGFEQVGALVPLVRYDDRFARAIGKWVLNVANASRLFYSNFLPDTHQDNENWTHPYDPNSYIAYEAMRRIWNNVSPYATGDAMAGGWAPTNLGLYGSSHVGIFGGIIDTTNVEMILQLDVLKTDYFHDNAYPTYLYFNPDSFGQMVEINVGSGTHDIYDAVTNNFLMTNVTGINSLNIPGNEAVLAAITPFGGSITYDLDKMLINGIVVDYRSGLPVANYPPRIKSLAANFEKTIAGGIVDIYNTAEDRDGDSLSYLWNVNGGIINGNGASVTWTAPLSVGTFQITSIVDDGRGGLDSALIQIEVIDNQSPQILSISASPDIIEPTQNTQIQCIADDPDGDTLSYYWNTNSGTITGAGSVITWTAPPEVGYYFISCTVSDGKGGSATDSIGIVVGSLIGFYPFSGNAGDSSGFENNGFVSGATLVDDRFGNPNSAYYFDGVDDFIRVSVHPSLNFREAVTVNFWMEIGQFFSREAYPISHGNWENRWKVSITNERIRWTIKTNNGIIDLDSQTQLVTDSLYFVSCFYDGSRFEIYINGNLDTATTWSGLILTTNIDLSIAQHLPGNNNYNFEGILDDIRIYNRALSTQEIKDLYSGITTIDDNNKTILSRNFILHQNYPNPFNPITTIEFFLPKSGNTKLIIHDVIGREVEVLLNEKMPAGIHKIQWDAGNLASGIYYYRLQSGDYRQTKKMLLLR